jgi:glycosyltransferase involved in cell wall biosynthesis
MKKVLRILNRFNVGGPTHNATYLTKFLDPDYETKLIGGKKLESEAAFEYLLKENNINYTILKNMNRSLHPIRDFKAFIEIRNIIKDYKPDIVHTHASKSGALGRLAALSLNVPIILHTFHGHVFHSYFGRMKTYFYILVERFLAKKSSAIIAISDLQKNELTKDFKICDDKKIHVIPLGFDLEKFQVNYSQNRENFREEFRLNNDDICIGIIGRLTLIKDHDFFIRAIKETLSKTKNSLKIFIIGDGEEKDNLINLSNELLLPISTPAKKNTNALIHFTSWRSDMTKVYAGLDIVALTSLNEGTPVTLIEAQASSKPIVSSDVGGVRDILEEGITGLLSPSKDMNSFVSNLLKIIEDKELRESMGASGYNNVYEKFSYRRLVADVKYLYESLINDKK